jgi:hypothetical protein
MGLGHAITQGYIRQQDQNRYITYMDVVLGSRSLELHFPLRF